MNLFTLATTDDVPAIAQMTERMEHLFAAHCLAQAAARGGKTGETAPSEDELADLPTNILKVYQFYPELMKLGVVKKILLKAIATSTGCEEPPATSSSSTTSSSSALEPTGTLSSSMTAPAQFHLHLCMLPESLVNEDRDIQTMCKLHELLTSGRFVDFWGVMRGRSEALGAIAKEIVGFDTAIRKAIVRMVGLTYREISGEVLARYLGLGSVNDLRALADECGFVSMEGGNPITGAITNPSSVIVQLPTNAENHPPKSTRIMVATELKLENVTNLIVKLEASSSAIPSASSSSSAPLRTSTLTKTAVERMRAQVEALNKQSPTPQ